MPTPEEHLRALSVARDLSTLTRTLKAMAAVTLRTFQQAVDAVDALEQAVEVAMQVALQHGVVRLGGGEPAARGVIVVGSDLGMCGTFNQSLITPTLNEGARILAVGSRAAEHLRRHGLTAEAVLSVPSSVAGLATTVYDLVVRLEAWGSTRLEVVYNVADGGGRCHAVRQPLMPWSQAWLQTLQLKPWKGSSLPQIFSAASDIRSELVRQYLFASLYAALARSIEAESGARLAAMQQAEHNIGVRLETLQREYHQLRQAAVTEELLDITSGFNVIHER
ncbi:MAG TPA: F0F1 ATP synthase subunit gamma [Candidatus Xenobia bacterium]|jgi:F-type H+-transporting ATPase subunit gamma